MTEAGSTDIFGGHERRATIAMGVMIALKIVLVFVFAWHIRLVMDEFAQLGYAKYLSNGLFDTVQPPKAVGFAVFYKLAHLIGWDATSILIAGRIQTALLACATMAMVYACARALGEDRARALMILLILLCFSNFAERIFRTRAEPLALFFAMAALLVIVRGSSMPAKRILAAGVLSGMSFLATQKAVYFNVALGLGLVADAVMARRYTTGIARGAWLVLGWTLPITAYCFAFGGSDPSPIAKSLVFGPMEVATRGDEYGGLRQFVLLTLGQNAILYLFCFVGMALTLTRIGMVEGRKRIALVFSIVVTALVFTHNQPWPYVFIMALPFMSLWALVPIDRNAARGRYLIVWVALATALTMSFVKNVRYLAIDNMAQLELVARAEALIGPEEKYFDGIGMLPNRQEPSTLWLDVYYVLATWRSGKSSEAYQIFSESPPKIILWSYRMENIYPVIAAAVRNSYVDVAPNIRMAGRRLYAGRQEVFEVPIAGKYRLYSDAGKPLRGSVEINGATLTAPFYLTVGAKTVTMRDGPAKALLLPAGVYEGLPQAGEDNDLLFADVYR